MAKPQVENGHTDIANEIVEALCRINLTSYEARVLWALFRKTYGWHKTWDRISYTQWEEITGINRWHIARTIKQLTARNVVTTRGNGYNIEFSFQKDYEEWNKDPKVRRRKWKLIMDGYVHRYLGPDNPFRPMCNANGYIAEHRLVMAKHLNRLLNSDEIVHHKNHLREDNKIGNLEIMTAQEHLKEGAAWRESLPLEVMDNKALPLEEDALPLEETPLPLKVIKPLPLVVNTKEKKETIQKKRQKKEDISKSFNIFWGAYPRKVARADAEKVFNKANPDAQLLETMLTAIELAKKSEGWQKENGKFIPHPATWLNGKRWEDEIVVKAPGTKSKFNDGWR
ncbi:hypothetical protein LCGC14_0791070 [marine sediment metagenome]|uniref:HNH nuclease domain-containing protein n=1 Tax=marine sediment metagenome TaxID=412755 RepID=A0A0F9PSK1_9ZZZZ